MFFRIPHFKQSWINSFFSITSIHCCGINQFSDNHRAEKMDKLVPASFNYQTAIFPPPQVLSFGNWKNTSERAVLCPFGHVMHFNHRSWTFSSLPLGHPETFPAFRLNVHTHSYSLPIPVTTNITKCKLLESSFRLGSRFDSVKRNGDWADGFFVERKGWLVYLRVDRSRTLVRDG